jgi:hypothetical protein
LTDPTEKGSNAFLFRNRNKNNAYNEKKEIGLIPNQEQIARKPQGG